MKRGKKIAHFSVYILCLSTGLLLNGAVPFLLLPTLGQAWWLSGFAQSMANSGLFSIYATNFGLPEPAGISFGLVAAKLQSILIQIKIDPAHAYTLTFAVIFFFAFNGCRRFCIYYRVGNVSSSLLALVWLSLPIVWNHAGYSTVSLGFSLLPTYLFIFVIYLEKIEAEGPRVFVYLGFFLVALFSVFVDGYSFALLAIGSCVILIMRIIEKRLEAWRRVHIEVIPTIAIFAVSAIVYKIYFGQASFDKWPIDYFRGFGLDPSYFFIPNKGVSWMFDSLSLTVDRDPRLHFGDSSVWLTTFGLPLLVLGVLRIRSSFRVDKFWSYAFLVLGLFAFYMALGPSMKFFSFKPEELGASMPAEYARFSTGSEYLSKYLPGFSDFRATYRWIALFLACTWMLLSMSFSKNDAKQESVFELSLLICLFALFTPDLIEKTKIYRGNLLSFQNLENEFVEELGEIVNPNELVCFLPYGNDFLVNYSVSKINAKSYNIGGDKNLFYARKFWPKNMKNFKMWKTDSDFVKRMMTVLVEKEADVVVLPHVDMLWAAHAWPYPLDKLDEVNQILQTLSGLDYVEIERREFLSSVRITDASEVVKKQITDSEFRILKPLIVEEFQFSKVGRVYDGSVYSQGKEGFLLYGPYTNIFKGCYRLTVFGEMDSDSSFELEITSNLGGRRLLHKVVSSTLSSTILVEVDVVIPDYEKALEIRIKIGDTDNIRIDSYSLVPHSLIKGSVQ